MKKLNIATLMSVAAMAIVVTSIGCKKKDNGAADTAVTTPAAAPAPPPAAPAESLHVTGVETGKGLNADKTIKDDAHDFGVRDTVYVSVKTEGAGSGKLGAKFTYQNKQTVNETSQNITTTGDTYTEFHLQKKTPWPKGDYRVLITLNGDSVGTKDFSIK